MFVSADNEWAIYRVDDAGFRHWVPDPVLVDGPVHEMPNPDLHAMPVGDPLVTVDAIRASTGMLIHDPATGRVWIIRHGLKCLVTDPRAMADHGFLWEALIDVGSSYLSQISDGPMVRPINFGVDLTSDIGNGHWMQTTAHGQRGSNTLWGTTRLTCTNKFIGFTGGLVAVYGDAAGNKIGMGEARSFGIDPPFWFGATHRNIDWQDTNVPADTNAVLVSQFWAPKDRFGEIWGAVLETMDKLATIYEDVSKWCEQNPQLCGLIQSAVAA